MKSKISSPSQAWKHARERWGQGHNTWRAHPPRLGVPGSRRNGDEPQGWRVSDDYTFYLCKALHCTDTIVNASFFFRQRVGSQPY